MSADPVKATAATLADTAAGQAEAVRILRGGGLVAFATETVYGLGGDATSPQAVARIYAAKGRPAFNPLIAHVATVAAARREGVFDRHADALAQAFWPGPLTLVLPRAATSTVCELARAGLVNIALRVPSHPSAHALLAAVERPIAAPSANRSGRLSPVEATDVNADLGDVVDAILDGGRSLVGVESTIVACLGDAPVVLRPGGIATAEIARVAGSLQAYTSTAITVPGQLASHYAPRAPVRLNALALEEGEAGLDFAAHFGGRVLDLSPRGDTTEAAANLYAYMRRLDSAGPRRIAVATIPSSGLGEAINDRLRRAAAPRA